MAQHKRKQPKRVGRLGTVTACPNVFVREANSGIRNFLLLLRGDVTAPKTEINSAQHSTHVSDLEPVVEVIRQCQVQVRARIPKWNNRSQHATHLGAWPRRSPETMLPC